MAIKLLERISIGPHSQYEIQIIESQNQQWLRLSYQNFKKSITFWSKEKNKNGISYKEVLNQLSKRLYLVIEGKITLTDAIQFWPSGWGYWGEVGTPAPIGDPIGDYWHCEFEDQINLYNAKILFNEYLKKTDLQSDYGICVKHICTLLLELSLPSQEDYGFATMLMLDYSDLVFCDGMAIGTNGVSFPITDLGKIISLGFSVVCEDQDWWCKHYEKRCLESHISRLAKGIVKKVRASHLVQSIDPKWFP